MLEPPTPFMVNFKRIPSPQGRLPSLPSRATPHSAAFDLEANIDEPQACPPGETFLIPSGLAIALVPFSFALILPRSGMAAKRGLAPINTPGLIDSDYRGEVRIALHNHSPQAQTIQPGARVAQILFCRGVHPVQFLETSTLPDSVRGEGGFGSTGEI